MICLGISEDFFDAGVTLCDGPRVVFASNEERYTRRKNEGGFPARSLEGLFDYTGIDPKDIDRVYVSGLMTPPLPIRLFPALHRWRFDTQRSREETLMRRVMDFVAYSTPMSHTSETALSRRLVRRMLPVVLRRALPRALRRKPIYFTEHHEAHAAGAWFCSGFEEALAVTADGMGDGLSLTVSRCTQALGIERLWSATSRDSFGLFFEVLCEGFGFMPCRDEGKITGLAACGNPEAVREPDPFDMEHGLLTYRGPYGRHGVHWVREHLMRKYGREHLAAWAQHLLEVHIAEVCRWWLRDTGLRRLVVAGGVFGNVKLNQRLHELEEVEQLFVYPNMGDGGLSLGAICAGERFAPQAVNDVFLGEDYSDQEIEAALNEFTLVRERMADPELEIAELLSRGHIVARFRGRMEWGPRALGNRSILARTTDHAVVDRLNASLKRSDFMPFAPAVLDEDATEYCTGVEAARHSAEFMTVCFNCTERMKREHPAIVHVDGTARAQLVRADHNPAFHRVISGFKERDGGGVLLNTSFNIHEEPIVRTPREAIAAFLNARLDFLAIGPFLVRGESPANGSH